MDFLQIFYDFSMNFYGFFISLNFTYIFQVSTDFIKNFYALSTNFLLMSYISAIDREISPIHPTTELRAPVFTTTTKSPYNPATPSQNENIPCSNRYSDTAVGSEQLKG